MWTISCDSAPKFHNLWYGWGEQALELLLIQVFIEVKEILLILTPFHAPVTIYFMGQIYFLKPPFKKVWKSFCIF